MQDFLVVVGCAVAVVGAIFLAMLFGPLFGAFCGWAIGLTPIGSWVAQGGHALGLSFAQGDLWALVAFLGFFTPGFRSQLKVEK